MVAIAIVAISTIKDGALALATGVIGVIGGFLYHPVKNQLTASPSGPSALSTVQPTDSDPTQTGEDVQSADNTIQDSPSIDATQIDQVVAAATTVTSTINPSDVINQAIQLVQNDPALLQDIVNTIGVVSGDQNLLTQVQNLLNNSNGDLNLITQGIAAVKALIPQANTNTAPVGA